MRFRLGLAGAPLTAVLLRRFTLVGRVTRERVDHRQLRGVNDVRSIRTRRAKAVFIAEMFRLP
jgi:hypothetical protein